MPPSSTNINQLMFFPIPPIYTHLTSWWDYSAETPPARSPVRGFLGRRSGSEAPQIPGFQDSKGWCRGGSNLRKGLMNVPKIPKDPDTCIVIPTRHHILNSTCPIATGDWRGPERLDLDPELLGPCHPHIALHLLDKAPAKWAWTRSVLADRKNWKLNSFKNPAGFGAGSKRFKTISNLTQVSCQPTPAATRTHGSENRGNLPHRDTSGTPPSVSGWWPN